MEIILLQDIKGLGKKNDVKEVNDGHARNFLFPRGLAQLATSETLQKIQVQQAKRTEQEEALYKRLLELARMINDDHIELSLKTDARGSVFGSVTREMILKALREHDLVGKEQVEIELAHPLKTLGEHQVTVDFKKGITAKLKVIVRGEK